MRKEKGADPGEGSAPWRRRRSMGGLSDDQGSLLKMGVRKRRKQRGGGENGEKLFHLAILPSVYL